MTGTRMIALLRGINLASRNRVAMADLREVFAGLGYRDAVTHLQSGNVVFTIPRRPPARLSGTIEKAIADDLGQHTTVILRTRDELAAVVEHNPLPERTADPAKLLVTFLSAAPDPAAVAGISADVSGPDEFRLVGKEIYVYFPNGLQGSKIGHAFWEKRLGVSGTARNWNTVTRLLSLADA
jgi:uncharacterized protein (DUF1697 family)